jgi:branched-chain amino acid transport system substrate-binding protein
MIQKILIILLLITITGCASIPYEDVIKVGYTGPLSGPVSGLGIDNMKGIELAIDAINAQGGINGKQIELIVEDDTFQSAKLIITFEKLTSVDQVDVVLSSTYNGILSAASIADEKEVVLVNSMDSTQEIADAGEYVFGAGIYAELNGVHFAQVVANTFNQSKVALVYNNDEAFVTLIRNSFEDTYDDLNGTIVFEDTFGFATTDFRGTLQKIAQTNVTSVVLIGWDESGFFVKQAKELGLDLDVIGLATFTSAGFKNNAGNVTGVNFLSWDPEDAGQKEIVRLYEGKYGSKPNNPLFVALGYDAMLAVADALSRGGDLHEAMYSVQDVQGLTGILSMDEDGIVRSIDAQDTVFTILANGAFEKVGKIE